MKKLELTEADYNSLLMMLGFATGAWLKKDDEMPDSFKKIVDWILIQGGAQSNLPFHTYWNDKTELKTLKERELAAELEGK